jgi:hypothetical protein
VAGAERAALSRDMWFICHRASCPRLMIAAMVAQDEREAARERMARQEAGEAARVAEQARMVAQGAEQLRQLRNAAAARAEALAALKSTMAAAHPDRGGDASAFIAALRAYRAARRG